MINDFMHYYHPGWCCPDLNELGARIANSTRWEKHDDNRKEAFFNRQGTAYYYGGKRGTEVRAYYPQPESFELSLVWALVEEFLFIRFEACFINYYLNEEGSIGWHADDSPSIDQTKPVIILSTGTTRLLHLRRFEEPSNEQTLKVEDGSLILMRPGMQKVYQHAIFPEPGEVGQRLSMVFRGLK